MTIYEVLTDIVSQFGQTAVAAAGCVDDSALSRFRSGQGGLSLDALQKIFDAHGVEVVTIDQMNRMEDMIEGMSDLWRKERRHARQ